VWRLMAKETLGQWRLMLPAIVATMVASALLTLIAAFGGGIRHKVLPRIVQVLPVDMVLVVPNQTKSMLMSLMQSSGGLAKRSIDDGTLTQIKAIDGVATVYPRIDVAVPMGARGGSQIFGQGMYTDLFAAGLPGELVKSSLDQGAAFVDKPDGPIPVLISPLLVDMFNEAVAPALGAPALSSDHIEGFAFDVVLGRSYMLGTRGQVGRERCYIAGVSTFALTLGITVPLKTARRWNATYGKKKSQYSGVYVKLDDVSASPRVLRSIKELGLTLDESSRRASEMVSLVMAIALVISASLLVMAMATIAQALHLFVIVRRVALAILRALGAGKGQIARLILTQALALGLAGGVLGVLLGWGLAATTDSLLRSSFPDVGLMAKGVTHLPISWALAIVGFCLAASLLASIRPVLTAVRQPVVEVLEGR
jgi:hypothetical protein